MDKGGLDLEYDSDKSAYYLYKDDLTLEPQETIVFNVKVKDIWVIPEEEIAVFRQETELIIGQLKNTTGYASGKETLDSIYKRLDEIIASQSDYTIRRDQHIGLYRSNLRVVEEIKEDIAKMEKLSEESEELPEESVGLTERSEKPSEAPKESLGFIERIKRSFRKEKK
ncbi:hypothetical protein ACFL28_02660 [Candidatus Omnitrophota bacterium]